MLRKLTIKRFKSIYDASLEFGRVNLFVGPNGAGKSNVLEAIGILASALSRGIDSSNLDLRGVRLSLPHLFKSAFKGHDLPKTFRLEAEFDHGRYDCSVRAGTSSTFLEFLSEAMYDGDRQIFGRSPHGAKVHFTPDGSQSLVEAGINPSRGLWDLLGPITKISGEFERELKLFSSLAIYAPQTAVMRGTAIDARVIEPLGLTGSRLAQAFHEVLTERTRETAHIRRFDEILRVIWQPGWADYIRVGPFNSEIVPPQVRSEGSLLYMRDKFMHTKRNYLSPYDASEGTLYLVFVATLLAHPTAPRAFALDNVDGTLNADLVRKLTDHIVRTCCANDAKSDTQAFMTSHHPASLDSFDIFNPEHCIFTANRSTDSSPVGATVFRGLRPPKNIDRGQWIMRNDGKNLSELLLEGRIPGALG